MISRACGNPVVYSAYWEILHAFLLSDDFFQNQLFQKKIFRNTIRVWIFISLDIFFGLDLGLNCLQR